MLKIELIYDGDCPNVEKAKEQLSLALKEMDLPEKWIEWDRGNPDAPDYIQKYGSPTILVNGVDVTGSTTETGGTSCRVYFNDEATMEGVPSVKAIQEAIRRSTSLKGRFLSVFAVTPAAIFSFVPILTCPLCWPAYTAILSAFGIGFFNYSPYLLPLLLFFLLLALVSLGWQAKKQKNYLPLLVGIIASGVILIGKFCYPSGIITFIGIGGLIGASIWSAVLSSKSGRTHCPQCEKKGG